MVKDHFIVNICAYIHQTVLQVKLSGKSDRPSMCWSGPGILSTATGESVLRLWDLANNNNYVLTLEAQAAYDKNEVLNCVSYSREKRK